MAALFNGEPITRYFVDTRDEYDYSHGGTYHRYLPRAQREALEAAARAEGWRVVHVWPVTGVYWNGTEQIRREGEPLGCYYSSEALAQQR